MPRVIVTGQVQDGAKWEAGFRTHVDIFRTYSLTAPIQYAIAGTDFAVYFEVDDFSTFQRAVESQRTIAAMESDGVKRETVKINILDKELKVDSGAASRA
jgi:hypothetical protein